MRPQLHNQLMTAIFRHLFDAAKRGAGSIHESTWPKGQPSVIESQFDPR